MYTFSVVRAFELTGVICFLVLSILTGCSNHAEEAHDAVLKKLSMEGKVLLKDGSALSSRTVQYNVTITGTGLFTPGKNGCQRSDPHMPALLSQTAPSGPTGVYSTNFEMQGAKSLANPACMTDALSAKKIESVRIDAKVPADEITCPAYCSAQGETASADCVTACEKGFRMLQASKTLTRAEIERLVNVDSSGALRIKQDLTFSALGPSITDGAGADLVVDAEAAKQSAHITRETFSPGDCVIEEKCVGGPGERKLLRFDGDIQNLGTSALFLGNPEGNPQFEYSSCHAHYHLENMMLYELMKADSREPVVVNGADIVGRKQGFCMMDIYSLTSNTGEPLYDCDNQGLSPGWEDTYDNSLDCQFLDVTDVPPGDYILRITVNPDGTFAESDTGNNSAELPVSIP